MLCYTAYVLWFQLRATAGPFQSEKQTIVKSWAIMEATDLTDELDLPTTSQSTANPKWIGCFCFS